MLITLKNGDKKVLDYIEDESKTVTFDLSHTVIVTTPFGENYATDTIIIDATSLNDENEELKEKVKDLKIDKIGISVCAFMSLALVCICMFIIKWLTR